MNFFYEIFAVLRDDPALRRLGLFTAFFLTLIGWLVGWKVVVGILLGAAIAIALTTLNDRIG